MSTTTTSAEPSISAALAMAADPEKYRPVAMGGGMPAGDIRSAADCGTEIHRSWRRTLAPLWMPQGLAPNEARLAYDGASVYINQIRSSELADVLRTAFRSFDWHSQVVILFTDGGASWSRSKRTVTVSSEYLQRFVRHGRLVAAQADP